MKEAKLILDKTDGGLDVFKHYLGDVSTSRTFRNPYREDSRASCRLYKNKSQTDNSVYYYLQDYGNSKFCGNCFAIAAKILGINLSTDFKRLLEQIDNDMSLGVFTSYDSDFHSQTAVLKKVVSVGDKGRVSSILGFTPIVKPYTEMELNYWLRYGITEDTLRRYDVKSVKSCTFQKTDGKNFAIVSSDILPIYGYFFNGGLGIKFYRPKAENRFMYAGSLPKPYVFGWNKLPKTGEDVFITGGEKDVLSLASHGFHAIAFNSETAKVPQDMIEDLAQRFKRIVFLYDSDATGIQESTMRVEEYNGQYNVNRLQLPLAGTKTEKDISDYFALGKSRQDFIELLNNIV